MYANLFAQFNVEHVCTKTAINICDKFAQRRDYITDMSDYKRDFENAIEIASYAIGVCHDITNMRDIETLQYVIKQHVIVACDYEGKARPSEYWF